jgi:Zn-dependent M28 family amino/carboxypeptidase
VDTAVAAFALDVLLYCAVLLCCTTPSPQHYDYFEVPFSVGDVKSKSGENKGSAKVFSFGLMTRMDEKATLRLFGEHYKAVLANPSGTDHPNIRSFIKNGFPGVEFPSGLAIVSKLQAYDDTDSAFATQAKISGEAGWDKDSDSWIP